jgi:hypothetical protein
MDFESHLDFLARHPYAVVFWSSLIEAAGVPFPSRVSRSRGATPGVPGEG